jgi:hypothetical protein
MRNSQPGYWTGPEANAVFVYEQKADEPPELVDYACDPLSYDFYADVNGKPIPTSDLYYPNYLGHCAALIAIYSAAIAPNLRETASQILERCSARFQTEERQA